MPRCGAAFSWFLTVSLRGLSRARDRGRILPHESASRPGISQMRDSVKTPSPWHQCHSARPRPNALRLHL